LSSSVDGGRVPTTLRITYSGQPSAIVSRRRASQQGFARASKGPPPPVNFGFAVSTVSLWGTVWGTRYRLYLEELEAIADRISRNHPIAPVVAEEQIVQLLATVAGLLRQHAVNKRGQCKFCCWTRWGWRWWRRRPQCTVFQLWVSCWVSRRMASRSRLRASLHRHLHPAYHRRAGRADLAQRRRPRPAVPARCPHPGRVSLSVLANPARVPIRHSLGVLPAAIFSRRGCATPPRLCKQVMV